MTTKTSCADFVQFFRSWVSDPLRVAAVAPSGERLARLMTQEIEPFDGPILELGPGTGVFTRALLARGVPESALTLVEFGEEFAVRLRERFPAARVVHMDAAQLGRCGLFDDAPFGAVISGLPLLSMPPSKVVAIVGGAFETMKPGGAFYQFTYGPRCPVQKPILESLGLTAKRIGGTVRNIPPAGVYRISRQNPLELSIAGSKYRSTGENAGISA
ncbi:SAM-dependent methyltransferase [Rhizobium dioscoreae]|uniref:class I SAM-dependent methyltransferase n=1 Tax=Rhizobium TaxID=379 RepID=UPI000DDE078E|nr:MULTISPECIES: methyltransferase domain-containing protein [Rhizobium]MCZ3375764.1 methyltransferase domain-containing protein [Rhizobium sp. AG207R]TWB16210.1 phospholipid N-methyltransferase [Rhizobium sp. ERR1071]GES42818.1 SAM-dependent methyltransferase [Rhizobium dioscoreae]